MHGSRECCRSVTREPPGETMVSNTSRETGAEEYLPQRRTLPELEAAADGCRGCALYEDATQAVFGAGPADAKLMLIGEIPGDEEDRLGAPFVGPAGKLLDEVLEEVGLNRRAAYVTNAVKHFKWKAAGKRRLHAKPTSREIRACRPWLEAELEIVAPQMIVCLGATAASVLLGSHFRITKQRGEVHETEFAEWTIATYHPSALLRVPDRHKREQMRQWFTADLRAAAEHLHRLA